VYARLARGETELHTSDRCPSRSIVLRRSFLVTERLCVTNDARDVVCTIVVVVVTFFNHNFVNCKATLILAIKIYEIKYNISLMIYIHSNN